MRIAYQTVGEGPPDLVWIFGFVGNLDVIWEQPRLAGFLEGLGSLGRVILHDRRGAGLSDRVGLGDLGTRLSDLVAVLDAVGSRQAVVIGAGEGGALAAMFAATHPERTQAFVMHGAMARMEWSPTYPWGLPRSDLDDEILAAGLGWGTEDYAKRHLLDDAPSMAADPAYVRWYAKLLRNFLSPSQAEDIYRIWYRTDVQAVLPSVTVPTLVVGRADLADETRHVASLIPQAELMMLPCNESQVWLDDVDLLIHRIGRLIGAKQPPLLTNRVLLTVLFTDIVASTRLLAQVGDARWRELLREHDRIVREMVDHFRGSLVDTAGDGTLATFDSPARAIRCAQRLITAVHPVGIELRAGVHTGECERDERGVAGITVHVGARIAALAGAGEVTVTHTVTDLVAGSGLTFADRGTHTLRGVPGKWHVFTCTDSPLPTAAI